MIHEIFDFFPFNMGSGPAFLLFYLALSISGLVVAILVRSAVGASLDRSAQLSGAAAVAGAPGGAPYRTPAYAHAPPRQRLSAGWIPSRTSTGRSRTSATGTRASPPR